MKICSVILFILITQVSLAQTKASTKQGHNRVKSSAGPTPDLVGLITVTPQFISGPTTLTALIDVVETNKVPTSGVITVYIQKNSSFINFKFDPAATSIGDSKVHNANWRFDDTTNPGYYILTSTNVLAGGAVSTIGLTGAFTTTISGKSGLSMTILKGSGGETNSANNSASTAITYSP